MTLGSAVTAGGPLRWQSASTVEGEGGSRTSEGDEGGALCLDITRQSFLLAHLLRAVPV